MATACVPFARRRWSRCLYTGGRRRRQRRAPGSRRLAPDATVPASMVKIRVLFESGEPERVIECDLSRAPFQHDGKPASILDVLLGHGIFLEHACGGNCACT